MHWEQRPAADEFDEYFSRYIDLVPEGDLLDLLSRQIEETLSLIEPLGDAGALKRYAPEKWSVKEMLGHLIDSERAFATRAMWFARGLTGPLAGFDQEAFVAGANFDQRSLDSLADEWRWLRKANVAMLRGLEPKALSRRGIANDCEFSVRAIAWIAAGHELHHRRVLQEKYLD